MASRADNLASTLQDTNRNLRAVDKMLEEYKDIGEQKTSAMDRLREDLARTSSKLREEKMRRSATASRSMKRTDLDAQGRRIPTSPLRDYGESYSDQENDVPEDIDRSRGRRSSVRFFDDMDTDGHIHVLHRSVRDIADEQVRIGGDLNEEIERRNRWEHQSRKALKNAQSGTQFENAMTTVDRRLQDIQEELQAERFKKQHEPPISSELKQALERHKVSAGQVLPGGEIRHVPSEAESQRNTQIESELGKLRWRLEQAEGSRHTLTDQLEEFRKQLNRAEEDKHRLRAQLERQEVDMRERKRRVDMDGHDQELREREHKRMEEEMKELRNQLTKSANVVGDYGELRRELERSETQRLQLSDHIQVLNKDLDMKERQSAKVINQLQDMTEKYEETERIKHQTLVQLEDALRKLRDTTKAAETVVEQLRETKQELRNSEQKKEELKARAQETVRQWKLKCKKIERDLDRFQHSTQQATSRSEQLIKELEMTRSHHNAGTQHLEGLKREFTEMLAMRAQQDEQLRAKDVEVNELKSLKMDLEKDLRDCKMVIERLEHELHTAREKSAAVGEEKAKYEDQVSAMQSGNIIAQNHLQQLQQEVRELNLMKVEMSAHLADAANEKQELKLNLQQVRRDEATVREEVDNLIKRLKEEKSLHASRVEAMKTELDQYRSRESQQVHELSRRLKKDQAEYEAEIQAIKIALHEERSNVKLVRKQNEKLKEEVDRINVELVRVGEENTQLQKKYLKVREDVISKSQFTQDGLSRAKEVELELLDAKEALRKTQKDHENVLHTVANDVDAVLEVATSSSIEAYKAVTTLVGLSSEPHQWLAELKNKLLWLKNDLTGKKDKEVKLRHDVRNAMINTDKDRQFLVSEIDRQNNILDQLACTKNELVEKDLQNTETVVALQEQVEELSETLQTEQEIARRKILESQQYEHPRLQDVQNERDKIHERYSKLQETMNNLRQELSGTKLYNDTFQSPEKDIPNTGYYPRTPEKEGSQRRVRISTPPHQGNRTPKRQPQTSNKTPPPLSMTDDEFLEKFLPKSPKVARPTLDESLL